MKTFKNFVQEKTKDKVIYVNNTLWITYSQSSGTTIYLPDLKKYLTDDSSDTKHFDNAVKNLVKYGSENKALKQKGNVKLFEVPVYPDTNPGTDPNSRYDIWDGNIKPNGKIYMVITQEKNVIVNFFKKKNEALSWMNSLK